MPAGDPLALGVPVLGLCYGMQWIAQASGGGVANEGREYGRAVARIAADSRSSPGSTREQTVWMSHGDSVVDAARGLPRHRLDGDARRSPAFENPERARLRGAVPSRGPPHGPRPRDPRELPLPHLRGPAGLDDGRLPPGEGRRDPARRRRPGAVICALSGGVDSSVTAILLREALGDRVHPILVDHGLMRAHERRQVVDAFGAPRASASTRSTPADLFLVARSPASPIPSRSGRSSAAPSSRSSSTRPRRIPGRALPRAGDALPGRHRVGLDQGAVGGHQDAPQRRRPARAARLRADRAGARALQGRGAAARRGARACRASSWRATRFPGPGWRCESPAR